MTKDEIRGSIRTIFTDEFGEERAEKAFAGEKVFAAHGEGLLEGMLDSLDRAEFAMAVEDHFDIQIDDVLMVSIVTVDQVVDLVDNLCGDSACGAH